MSRADEALKPNRFSVGLAHIESEFADDFQQVENMLADRAADAQLTAFKHTLALLGWKVERESIVKRKYGRLNG